VVDGTPQIVRLPIDLYEDLIEVPAPIRVAFHPTDPLALDVGCEHRPKPVPPQPHGFMADVDAAFEEQIFDVAPRKRIPDIQHHDHADDLRRRMKVAKRVLLLVHLPWLASPQISCHPFDSARQTALA